MEIKLLFEKLDHLYNELPVLSCKGCGQCCVSPTCTLVEAMYLFAHCKEILSEEVLRQKLLATPEVHQDFEGNIRCQFIDQTKCSIHPVRTGACRLFGIPELSEFSINKLENCNYGTKVISGRHDKEFILGWLDEIVILNNQLYPFNAEPYFIRGFNIACWLDIYFDDSLTNESWIKIRSYLKEAADLSFLGNYKLKTGIKEKVDKISILSMILSFGEKEELQELLMSIRDDFPMTGSYFYEEANKYISCIDSQ